MDLVRILLEPAPDISVARELVRDLGRHLKRQLSAVTVADALARLTPRQRGSGPQDRAFVRSVLLQRLRGDGWTANPIVQPAATHDVHDHDEEDSDEEHAHEQEHDETGPLEDGSWSWRVENFTIAEADKGRWGVLHLWLKNGADEVRDGQPVAIVVSDAEHAYSWSPLATQQGTGSKCPDGCRGSLASVALEGEQEVLGHLIYPLPADAAPDKWGLQIGEHGHLRPIEEAAGK